MKTVLFILLICVSSTSFGQDSTMLKFAGTDYKLDKETGQQINSFLAHKNTERISLTAYFSSEGNASRNRILANLRLNEINNFLSNNGIPFNKVFTFLKLTDAVNRNGVVKIEGFFSKRVGSQVIKKSDKVQISLVNVSRKPTEDFKNNNLALSQKGEAKKTEDADLEGEPEIVLDQAAFKKDATVSLPNLIFQGSSHYFLASSERILRALLKVMQERPDIEIELQGHVCCNPPGVDGFDKITGRNNLSVMRAKAVYNYLADGGIDKSRMSYRGFGSSNRLYPDEKNATEQKLNRRVEVLITASD